MTRRILSVLATTALFACADVPEGDLDTGDLDGAGAEADEKVSFHGVGGFAGNGNLHCGPERWIHEAVGYGVSRDAETAMANAERKAWEKTEGACRSGRFAERGTIELSRSGSYLTNATYAVCYSCE